MNHHIHLVSDSTGETASSVARAALAQFDHIDPKEHMWTLIRSKTQMEKVISAIEQNPGVVLYTLVDGSLKDMLVESCRTLGIPCIPILAQVLTEIANYYGTETAAAPGKQYALGAEYFSRVEAINFSLTHDDGQSTWDLENADIVLVGASRTSKSPTSLYLAFKGYKSANVPYVHGVALPETLFSLSKPVVIGLVISPERLVDIRRNRLLSINHDKETDYVDIDKVRQEIMETKRLFAKNNWAVIDVTRKSVEETAANIINIYNERRGIS